MSTSQPTELLDLARQAVHLAKSKGASDAAATATRSRGVNLTWRDGKVEKVEDATSRSLSLQLYVEGRYGSMSTSDLRADALARFVESAVGMTRAIAKDPFRTLPDANLYQGRSAADLQLFDPTDRALDAKDRQRVAQEMEASARAQKGAERILSVTTSCGENSRHFARVASNGFEGEERSTSFDISAEVSLKDDDGRRPEDGSYAVTRWYGDLPSPARIGEEAMVRVLGKLGSKKAASAVLPVVIDARAVGRLLGALVGPMSGFAIQQKRSFVEGKLGEPVASKLITLRDEPLIPKGLASRRFDGEGIAARPMPIIEAGKLSAYYIDTYYGKKLQKAPTTGSRSNLVLSPGTKSLAELLRDIKDGILVTGFLGGNSNETTGDFSFGIAGFRIRNGQKVEPVAEMNIAGNLLTVWKKAVAVGNDVWLYSSMRTPSVVFDGVSVAGV